MENFTVELYDCNSNVARFNEPAAFACGGIDKVRKIGAFHVYNAIYVDCRTDACYIVHDDNGEPIELFESSRPAAQFRGKHRQILLEMAGIE